MLPQNEGALLIASANIFVFYLFVQPWVEGLGLYELCFDFELPCNEKMCFFSSSLYRCLFCEFFHCPVLLQTFRQLKSFLDVLSHL